MLLLSHIYFDNIGTLYQYVHTKVVPSVHTCYIGTKVSRINDSRLIDLDFLLYSSDHLFKINQHFLQKLN